MRSGLLDKAIKPNENTFPGHIAPLDNYLIVMIIILLSDQE